MLISSGYVVYLDPSVSVYPGAYPCIWNAIGTPRRPTIVWHHHQVYGTDPPRSHARCYICLHVQLEHSRDRVFGIPDIPALRRQDGLALRLGAAGPLHRRYSGSDVFVERGLLRRRRDHRSEQDGTASLGRARGPERLRPVCDYIRGPKLDPERCGEDLICSLGSIRLN